MPALIDWLIPLLHLLEGGSQTHLLPEGRQDVDLVQRSHSLGAFQTLLLLEALFVGALHLFHSPAADAKRTAEILHRKGANTRVPLLVIGAVRGDVVDVGQPRRVLQNLRGHDLGSEQGVSVELRLVGGLLRLRKRNPIVPILQIRASALPAFTFHANAVSLQVFKVEQIEFVQSNVIRIIRILDLKQVWIGSILIKGLVNLCFGVD